MRWFALTLAYNGTAYGGWQIQPNARSIQHELNSAIASATGERVRVVGSGRTDAGVHARAQVASFTLQGWQAGADRLVPAINRHLPDDIACRHCLEAKPNFHAIRDAIGKRYRYTVHAARHRDPLAGPFHWHVPQIIDLERMEQASRLVVGKHDFAGFQSQGAHRRSTVRTVHEITLNTEPACDGRLIQFEIEADGFLYNMVRHIVGTLVAVGIGTFGPERVASILESGDRRRRGMTAPACGLCLMQVTYPASCFDPSQWTSQATRACE
jgi:tRNA pseudouridine38-40 synthase